MSRDNPSELGGSVTYGDNASGNVTITGGVQGNVTINNYDHAEVPPTPRQRLDELWNNYKNNLSEQVSKVRLLGEAESRELKQVFIELSISEEYRRPSARNEWMGFVDAELRKRRSIFGDSSDGQEEKERKTVRPDDLLHDRTRAVITGAPGCGKSTLLCWLAGKILNDNPSRLPVFLELKSINRRIFEDCRGHLIDLLFEQAIASPLHFDHQSEREHLKADFMARLARHQAAIFLDGLDEVSNMSFFDELCSSLDHFIGSDYGRNLLIISTRPYALNVRFQNAKEMEIAPLNQLQVSEFLHHYYGKDPGLDMNALIQKLKRRELNEMIRVPVLLGALVRRYHEKGEMTGGRLNLYEGLVRDLAVMVDREKNINRYSFSDKEGRRNLEFLERIAFGKLFEEQVENDTERLIFDGNWILGEAKEFCSRGNIDAYDFAADIKATPLLREVAEDVWAFSHLTIQEYLAARALVGRSDCEAIFCRAYFNPMLVEMEALPMALGLSKKPERLYELIEQLPESLNFTGLRLRARGLAYGAGIPRDLLASLADRLIDFVSNAYIEETSYSDSIIRSFSGIESKHSDYIDERVGQVLKSEHSSVRQRAAEALREIGGEYAVPALIGTLKDEDMEVRRNAIFALGDIGGEQAVDALIKALKSEDTDARLNAAFALSQVGGEQIVVALIDILKDEDSVVRQGAAFALGKIGGEQAVDALIEALIEALNDFDGSVLRSAAEALSLIGREQAILALTEALKDKDSLVRQSATFALGYIGGGQAVAPLIAALKDEDSLVCQGAAFALGKIGGEQAVDALIEALRSEDTDTRQCAADALGEIGGERAIAVLIRALKDEDSSVRRSAAEALGKIGGEQAVDALIEALEDEDSWARLSAAEALGEIGGEQVIAVLIAILRDDNRDVRRAAAEALGKIGGEQAITDLIKALKDEVSSVRWSAAVALGKIGGEQAVAGLIQALRDEDIWLRCGAAGALGKNGGEQAVDFLIWALKDKDRLVRQSATFTLGKIGGGQAVAALIDALKDGDSLVRSTAACALDQIEVKLLVKGLQSAMSNQNVFVRKKAAEVISYYFDGQDQEALKLMAERDSDPDVRRTAQKAITRLELKKKYFNHDL